MRYNLEVFRAAGRAAALQLRSDAADLTGTEIIDREQDAPAFDPQKDYTGWPAGSPVRDEGQVWLLIQPYNAAHFPYRPSEIRSIWGLAHTTDPTKAKPWVNSYGISGMYMMNECYVDDNGLIWQSLDDNVVRPASEQPEKWKQITL